MIVQTGKPECFAHIDGADYLGLKLDEEICGYCAIQIHDKMASIHLVFKKWTPSVFRESLKDWEIIRNTLKIRGVTQIVASQENDKDPKFDRFIKHFGFGKTQLVKMAVQEI